MVPISYTQERMPPTLTPRVRFILNIYWSMMLHLSTWLWSKETVSDKDKPPRILNRCSLLSHSLGGWRYYFCCWLFLLLLLLLDGWMVLLLVVFDIIMYIPAHICICIYIWTLDLSWRCSGVHYTCSFPLSSVCNWLAVDVPFLAVAAVEWLITNRFPAPHLHRARALSSPAEHATSFPISNRLDLHRTGNNGLQRWTMTTTRSRETKGKGSWSIMGISKWSACLRWTEGICRGTARQIESYKSSLWASTLSLLPLESGSCVSLVGRSVDGFSSGT